jgi:hypothetical protein
LLIVGLDDLIVDLAEANKEVGMGRRRVNFVTEFSQSSLSSFEPFWRREGQQGGLVLAEEALAEVGAGVNVLRVTFEGGAVAGFGRKEFALLEIDVAELGMMMGFVEVVDLGLEFLDASAVVSATAVSGQPSCRSQSSAAIARRSASGGCRRPAVTRRCAPATAAASTGRLGPSSALVSNGIAAVQSPSRWASATSGSRRSPGSKRLTLTARDSRRTPSQWFIT